MLRPARLMLPFAALLAIIPSDFGGWAVITLDDLPDALPVGEPVTVTYAVRQHGRTLLGGLNGALEAESRGDRVRVAALPTGESGRYRATLTAPRGGNWTLTVLSGFRNSRLTLLPLPAVHPGREAPAVPDAERGRRLFVAKGCLTCHAHDEVPASGVVDVGPQLSGRRFDPDYLGRVLADPSVAAPRGRGGFQMPDLRLREAEIAALVAFLTGGRAVRASSLAAP